MNRLPAGGPFLLQSGDVLRAEPAGVLELHVKALAVSRVPLDPTVDACELALDDGLVPGAIASLGVDGVKSHRVQGEGRLRLDLGLDVVEIGRSCCPSCCR